MNGTGLVRSDLVRFAVVRLWWCGAAFVHEDCASGLQLTEYRQKS